MASRDDHPSFDNVRTMTGRVLKHPTELKFIESSVIHALQKVGAEFEFPRPPFWPFLRRQDPSDR
jgi:hypothetical protein